MDTDTTAAKKAKTPSLETLVRLCEEIAYDRKAENILRLTLKEFSAVSDYFILCTGTSNTHVNAIADHIRRDVLEKTGIKPIHTEGVTRDSGWTVVDYGGVMIHVMTSEKREEYQLESLWSEAPRKDAVKRIEEKLRKKAENKAAGASGEEKAAKTAKKAPVRKKKS